MLKKIALATIAAMALSIATPTLTSNYLSNTKSGKFHFADCRTIKHPDAPHFVHYSSRDEAVLEMQFASNAKCMLFREKVN